MTESEQEESENELSQGRTVRGYPLEGTDTTRKLKIGLYNGRYVTRSRLCL